MMINVNKKEKAVKSLSMAIKLMSLAVVMNLVGCDCKDKDGSILAIEMESKEIHEDIKTAKLKIKNQSKSEFNPADSELTVVVSKVTVKEQTGQTASTGAYKIGTKTGKPGEECVFKLSEVLTDKIVAGDTKTVTIEFTDLDKDKDDHAKLTISIKEKDGKKEHAPSHAELTWKHKK